MTLKATRAPQTLIILLSSLLEAIVLNPYCPATFAHSSLPVLSPTDHATFPWAAHNVPHLPPSRSRLRTIHRFRSRIHKNTPRGRRERQGGGGELAGLAAVRYAFPSQLCFLSAFLLCRFGCESECQGFRGLWILTFARAWIRSLLICGRRLRYTFYGETGDGDGGGSSAPGKESLENKA